MGFEKKEKKEKEKHNNANYSETYFCEKLVCSRHSECSRIWNMARCSDSNCTCHDDSYFDLNKNYCTFKNKNNNKNESTFSNSTTTTTTATSTSKGGDLPSKSAKAFSFSAHDKPELKPPAPPYYWLEVPGLYSNSEPSQQYNNNTK
ncbi:hypothetical protein TYRP_009502 [Tyrophagus putrescentiae]|nr:hypothetical protein TYRP_009502 [Tyrophagus putrescentiae]